MRNAEEVRNRIKAWEESFAQFSPAVRPTLDWVPSQLRWVLGEDDSGALRKSVWALLISELHDARCTMRKEGSDLVLEGRGGPPDFRHRGRSFRFWLRLKDGRYEDRRGSRAPIHELFILYREDAGSRFGFTSQDDTLSGIIEFSCNDYEFRMWDHTMGTEKS